MIATGDDLRMPTTTGAAATAATRMQHRYLDRVLAAATTDEEVLAAVMRAFSCSPAHGALPPEHRGPIAAPAAGGGRARGSSERRAHGGPLSSVCCVRSAAFCLLRSAKMGPCGTPGPVLGC